MNKKKTFSQKLFLDQLGSNISEDNYEDSLQKLRELCIYNPFRTQIFVQVFIQAWCGKIINMLNNNFFNDASSRINSLYMLVKNNSNLNKLCEILLFIIFIIIIFFRSLIPNFYLVR